MAQNKTGKPAFKGLSKSNMPAISTVNISGELARRGFRRFASPSDLIRQAPKYYHPLYDASNLQLPTKTREINQWCRHWYKTDPVVKSAIDIHSEFPLSGFENVCEDDSIKAYFDEMAFDILKLPRTLLELSLDWWKLGNTFPFGEWNYDEGRWERIFLLNPDFIEIEKSLFAMTPVLKFDPDETTKRICSSRQPKEQYEQLLEIDEGEFVKLVAKGQKVPLNGIEMQFKDPEGHLEESEMIQNVWHLAHKLSPYEVVGTPLMYSVFKPLVYKDEVRQMQKAIMSRQITPIKVVKVGSEQFPANQEAIVTMRNLLDQATEDPNAFIVYNHTLMVEYITGAGHTMPLTSEYEWIDKELYTGLGVSKNMLVGDGPTYSAASSIGFQILINKYLRFQSYLAQWIEELYKTVARAQGFYKIDPVTKKPKLIYPRITWELMKLKDDVAQKRLALEMQAKGLISKRTARSIAGFDSDKEDRLIMKENAKGGGSSPLAGKKVEPFAGGGAPVGGAGTPMPEVGKPGVTPIPGAPVTPPPIAGVPTVPVTPPPTPGVV